MRCSNSRNALTWDLRKGVARPMKAEWAMYRGAQRLEVTSDKLQEEKFRDVIGWVTNSPSSLSYSGALWNWNLFERTRYLYWIPE